MPRRLDKPGLAALGLSPTDIANWDAGGGGGGDFFHQAKVILNNDQIKALPTTAIEIVSAGGENTILIPTFCFMHLHWVADYDNIGDNANLGIKYAGGASSPLALLHESASEVGNLLIDGASHPAFLPLSAHVISPMLSGRGQYQDDPGTINAALEIAATNLGSHTGDFTSGDAGNTLTVAVIYTVFDTTTGEFS